MTNERRTFLRAPISLAVKYKGVKDIEVEAFTVTLGGGGVFIETFHPLQVNEDLMMELHLPGSTEKTVVEGRVVWNRTEYSDEDPPGMGVKFSKISRHDQEIINNLITRILSGSAEEGY